MLFEDPINHRKVKLDLHNLARVLGKANKGVPFGFQFTPNEVEQLIHKCANTEEPIRLENKLYLDKAIEIKYEFGTVYAAYWLGNASNTNWVEVATTQLGEFLDAMEEL